MIKKNTRNSGIAADPERNRTQSPAHSTVFSENISVYNGAANVVNTMKGSFYDKDEAEINIVYHTDNRLDERN